MCFYGVQHAAGRIAIVRAVNNIQLYVSLFTRGPACFRSCFTLFSLSHYLYYTTRARGMSNGTSSFEYHISKYTLYFSKYREFFCFFAFFWKNSVFFCFTGEQVYIDI